MFLIHYGCDPEWLLEMDMLAFDALAEIAMKLEAQQRIDDTYQGRLVAHDADGNKVEAYIKNLQKITGIPSAARKDGDDLVKDLGKIGMMK